MNVPDGCKDTGIELITRWGIIVLQQTASINTNSSLAVFINIKKANESQQLSKQPHESMHDLIAACLEKWWQGEELVFELRIWMDLRACHRQGRRGNGAFSPQNQPLLCI